MNDAAMDDAVRKAAKKKFGRKRTLESKLHPHFPESLAREYERVAGAYMGLLAKALAAHLPAIRRAIEADRMRLDDAESVHGAIARAFAGIQREMEGNADGFRLDLKIGKLADMTRARAVREWRRAVKRTLGLDLLEDYYLGEFYGHALKMWTEANVKLIKGIEADALARIRRAVEDGYAEGLANRDIGRTINRDIGRTINGKFAEDKRRAQFVARDQIAKLNADVSRKQQEDAGVTSYKWSASGDARVRDCHAEFDGKQFDWDDPPDNWHDTKSRGRVHDGPAHPGEAVGCRCVPIAVFDIERLSLPLGGA
jgi:SPP1 gp7 family putative phage head morphogenesis protein